MAASELLDLLSFGFKSLGIEFFSTSQTDFKQGLKILTPGWIPWSHGLLMSLVWSAAVAVIAFLLTRNRQTSGILGLVVLSHWVLDFIVHPADLPLLFNRSPTVRLGLWTFGPGFVLSGILEIAMLAGGVVVYLEERGKKPAAP